MTTILTLAGMRSVHCARAVYTALGGVDGVQRADVVVGRATVEHDARATVDAMREAVALAGYAVVDAERSRELPTL
jgi:copper chaperone CopZ